MSDRARQETRHTDHPGPATGKGPPRREFLRVGARLFTLAGMGVLAGRLIAKRGITARRDSCIADGICSRCLTLGDCGNPNALSARRAKGRS